MTKQRSRPLTFVPPPPFNPSTNHNTASTTNTRQNTCSISATTKCTSTSSTSSKRHTLDRENGRLRERERELFPNSSSSCGSDGKTGGGGGSGGVRRQHGVGGVKPVPGALKMLHVNSPHALDDRERGTTSGEFSRPLVLIYSHSRFNYNIFS